MRILMIQPNCHDGGAEIAGNGRPSWATYIGGALRHAGFNDIRFVDAMVARIDDAELREIICNEQPDVVLASAVTPMICKAQSTLKMAKDGVPDVVTILRGIHPRLKYARVLADAPWIDYIVRGEDEEIVLELLGSIQAGNVWFNRSTIRGIAYLDHDKPVATPARSGSRPSKPSSLQSVRRSTSYVGFRAGPRPLQ